MVEAYGKLPLAFEPNLGQADREARFVSHGEGFGLALSPTAATMSLGTGSTVRMEVVGASSSPGMTALEPLPDKSNYLRGSDPALWQTDVPQFAKVGYAGVYPGIDLVFYGSHRRLEYDFVTAPGADPAAVRLRFEGTAPPWIDGFGNLVLDTPEGALIHHAPTLHQEAAGRRKAVEGRYVLVTDQVGFLVGSYDKRRALVTTPSWSTRRTWAAETTSRTSSSMTRATPTSRGGDPSALLSRAPASARAMPISPS